MKIEQYILTIFLLIFSSFIYSDSGRISKTNSEDQITLGNAGVPSSIPKQESLTTQPDGDETEDIQKYLSPKDKTLKRSPKTRFSKYQYSSNEISDLLRQKNLVLNKTRICATTVLNDNISVFLNLMFLQLKILLFTIDQISDFDIDTFGSLWDDSAFVKNDLDIYDKLFVVDEDARFYLDLFNWSENETKKYRIYKASQKLYIEKYNKKDQKYYLEHDDSTEAKFKYHTLLFYLIYEICRFKIQLTGVNITSIKDINSYHFEKIEHILKIINFILLELCITDKVENYTIKMNNLKEEIENIKLLNDEKSKEKLKNLKADILKTQLTNNLEGLLFILQQGFFLPTSARYKKEVDVKDYKGLLKNKGFQSLLTDYYSGILIPTRPSPGGYLSAEEYDEALDEYLNQTREIKKQVKADIEYQKYFLSFDITRDILQEEYEYIYSLIYPFKEFPVRGHEMFDDLFYLIEDLKVI